MANTLHSVVYKFETTTEGKSYTKTFSDYNTSVSDDNLRTVGKTIAEQELFASDENGVISGLTKIERVDKQITDITQASA